MPCQVPAQPRSRIDAAHVLANPAAYADRPTLVHLAQLVCASAKGQALAQTRNEQVRAPCRPRLIVIEGGRT
ncbi:MAG: hypothetical protein HOY44_07315 [Maritimibacter sp.]|uniref:hypothetical protein n=1 Tax=Maritimibacter sp. TaxID=2003363 RepID=UPI001DCD4954|nr:hypothetical protein [Maritimibacter sp.]MBL6427321.1 hypothetical protein [Maritimibacter sp.]